MAKHRSGGLRVKDKLTFKDDPIFARLRIGEWFRVTEHYGGAGRVGPTRGHHLKKTSHGYAVDKKGREHMIATDAVVVKVDGQASKR